MSKDEAVITPIGIYSELANSNGETMNEVELEMYVITILNNLPILNICETTGSARSGTVWNGLP